MGSHKVDYAVLGQRKPGESLNNSMLAALRNSGVSPYYMDKGTDALGTAGIRLAASTATCVLIVAIIILLMHKFRRHRFFLNIRGIRGQSSSNGDTGVTYSSGCDEVDIDISYERLHIPGAPPPYSPTCEDLELPPAYSAVPNSASTAATDQNGVINTGCQTTPPESLYNIVHETEAKGHTESSVDPVLTRPPFDDMKLIERTCGVGASNTDLTLTVDLSDSCNELKDGDEEPLSSASSLSPYQPRVPKTSRSKAKDTRLTPLPVRLDPVGGELPTTPTALGCSTASSVQNSSATQNASASCGSADRRSAACKSADSSPTVLRNKKVTLTQYGFIDDGSISDLLECNGTVVGLNEEQLIDIAANKPDRLNARVRRQNRKWNSKPSPSTPDMQESYSTKL